MQWRDLPHLFWESHLPREERGKNIFDKKEDKDKCRINGKVFKNYDCFLSQKLSCKISGENICPGLPNTVQM